MTGMILLTLGLAGARDPSRRLHVDPVLDGDCFNTPCSLRTATLTVRCADVLYFSGTVITPTSYPSEFSDIFLQMSLMNATAFGRGTVIDGRLLAGEMLWQITSHAVFTWVVIDNFTFRHFAKPIATRQYAWSAGSYVVFRGCVFEDSTADLFSVHGGTLLFENCVFRNVSGRAVKAVGQVAVDMVACAFENCAALFFAGSDAAFTNCRFTGMRGQRGGAVYAAKTTLLVDHCVFRDCAAAVNGGALYVRDSAGQFESEVRDSCFVGTRAAVNGSAIFTYASRLEGSGNCFADEESVACLAGTVNFTGSVHDRACSACLRREPAEGIEYGFEPVDTNRWYQLDDLKPGTEIVLDDDL